MLNGKALIINLIVGLIKKTLLYKTNYFPEPYNRSTYKIKVELDLFNYATKSDFKNTTGVGTSDFGKRVDLACLKSDVHELNIGRLKTSC